jgi:hypothetical protein
MKWTAISAIPADDGFIMSGTVIELRLFDDVPFATRPPARPRFDSPRREWSGSLSHPQFEYERTRAVFGNRAGWGPLLIAPDTNLLIDLVDAFDSVESHFGIAGPLPFGDRTDRVSALRDLFALWFHRDIRWVISQHYLDDAKKPLSAARRADRRRVMEALGQDLADRGGIHRGSHDWDLDDHERADREQWDIEDERSRIAVDPFAAQAESMLTGHDGLLVADALRNGCHVFLTEDRGVLARAQTLFGWGIAAVRPGELLDALDEGGELGPEAGAPGWAPAPDLSSLARFYAIEAP